MRNYTYLRDNIINIATMETKKKIEELREQISNLDWVMCFILDQVKKDRDNIDAVTAIDVLVGLNNTKYELQTLLAEYEYKAKKEIVE